MTDKKKAAKSRSKTAAPKARKAAAKAPRRAARQKGLEIHIDFPQAGEVVRPGRYTFRVGTTPAVELVEISIDGSDWLKCRNAAGYWWYDWSDYEPGPHRLVARTKGPDGEHLETDSRRFRVGVEAEDSAGGAAPDESDSDGGEPVPIDEEPEPPEEAEE